MHDAAYIRVPLRRMDRSIKAYALIDQADAHLAERHWYQENRGYVSRMEPGPEGQRKLRLHRVVMGLPRTGLPQVDHINRDKLDNRRANLRIATPALNAQNRSAIGRTSKYRGVSWNRATQKWTGHVTVFGRNHYLGRWVDEREAAAASEICRILFMPFANNALD